jgi:DNA-binding MarR family transcriptional regulator
MKSQGLKLTAERLALLEVKAKSHEYAARRLRARVERAKAAPVVNPPSVAKAVAGGSSEALVRRKFSAGMSDLQLLTLFSLAKLHLLTLTDLAQELGVGASTAWHATERLAEWGLVHKDTLKRPFEVAYFVLTDEGKRKVAWLLGR